MDERLYYTLQLEHLLSFILDKLLPDKLLLYITNLVIAQESDNFLTFSVGLPETETNIIVGFPLLLIFIILSGFDMSIFVMSIGFGFCDHVHDQISKLKNDHHCFYSVNLDWLQLAALEVVRRKSATNRNSGLRIEMQIERGTI